MKQQIHTVIFDLDGTLIRTEDLKDAFKQIAISYGCTPDEAQEVYRLSRTRVNPETGKEEMAFCREYFEEQLKTFLKEYKGRDVEKIDFARLDEVLNDGLLIDGAAELIKSAKEKKLN